MVDDLEQWQRILVKEFTSKLVDEIKAKSMAYRHDNWISLPDHCALEPLILSSTAGEMFQVSRFECRFQKIQTKKSRETANCHINRNEQIEKKIAHTNTDRDKKYRILTFLKEIRKEREREKGAAQTGASFFPLLLLFSDVHRPIN